MFHELTIRFISWAAFTAVLTECLRCRDKHSNNGPNHKKQQQGEIYRFFPRISFCEVFVLFMIYCLVLCSENDSSLTIFHIRCPYCMTTGFYLFYNSQPRIFKTRLGSFFSLVTTSNKDYAGQIRKRSIKFNIEGKKKFGLQKSSHIFFFKHAYWLHFQQKSVHSETSQNMSSK